MCLNGVIEKSRELKYYGIQIPSFTNLLFESQLNELLSFIKFAVCEKLHKGHIKIKKLHIHIPNKKVMIYTNIKGQPGAFKVPTYAGSRKGSHHLV